MDLNDNKEKRIIILNKKVDLKDNKFLKNDVNKILNDIKELKKTIKQEGNRFIFLNILKDKYIIKSNNLKFKEKIDFDFILDNKEYKFSSNIISINEEEQLITLEKPNEIDFINLKKININEPIGILFKEKNIELIGNIDSINENNLELTFEIEYFEESFFKNITKNYITSVIFYNIENNNKELKKESNEQDILINLNLNYISFLIKIIEVNKNIKENKIKITCSFLFEDEKENEDLINYIKEKENEIEYNILKEKTYNFLEKLFL